MQAGETKFDRETTKTARALERIVKRGKRRAANILARVEKKTRATINEDRKRAAAQPSAIAEVKAAYALQCANRRAEKAAEKAAKKAEREKANAVPTEAAAS